MFRIGRILDENNQFLCGIHLLQVVDNILLMCLGLEFVVFWKKVIDTDGTDRFDEILVALVVCAIH